MQSGITPTAHGTENSFQKPLRDKKPERLSAFHCKQCAGPCFNSPKSLSKPHQQVVVVLECYLLPHLYSHLMCGPLTARTLLKLNCQGRGAMLQWLVFRHGGPLGFHYSYLVNPGMRAVIPTIRVGRISSVGDSNSRTCQTCHTVDDSAYLKGGLTQARQWCSFRGCTVRAWKDTKKCWTNCPR